MAEPKNDKLPAPVLPPAQLFTDVNVRATAREFFVMLGQDQGPGRQALVAYVACAPATAKLLLGALQNVISQYESQVGPIQDPAESRVQLVKGPIPRTG